MVAGDRSVVKGKSPPLGSDTNNRLGSWEAERLGGLKASWLPSFLAS